MSFWGDNDQDLNSLSLFDRIFSHGGFYHNTDKKKDFPPEKIVKTFRAISMPRTWNSSK
jgi:hypothetical protein